MRKQLRETDFPIFFYDIFITIQIFEFEFKILQMEYQKKIILVSEGEMILRFAFLEQNGRQLISLLLIKLYVSSPVKTV